MEHLVGLIGLAVALFVSTDIDDVFVLLGFFADPKFRMRQIVVGQCLGIIGLYGASVVASLIALVIAPAFIGLLGLAPIAIGLKKAWDLRKGADTSAAEPADHEKASAGHGNVVAVAAVTLANGGDNISIYTPLFAARSAYDVAVIGVVFALMTLVWLWAAHWLTHHRTLGAPIRRYGHRVVPFVLIALGILILHEAGTFELLR
jgi:cadmium resistance protein CadD (predicted permease)